MRSATILDTTTARAIGVPDAVFDLVVPQGLAGGAIATILPGNPLADDWVMPLDLPGDLMVAWSGTLAEGEDGLFADEPRTWMGEGHGRFESFCDGISDALVASGRRLCFRPHARHVLSDPQGTLDFLRRRDGGPFGLALAPADLLLPDMLPDAEDHFTRILEFMVPRADLVLLHDARPAVTPDEDPERLHPCPLGEGVLPRGPMMEAVLRLLRDDAWVVSSPADAATATEWRTQG
jgi:hypothetical protein